MRLPQGTRVRITDTASFNPALEGLEGVIHRDEAGHAGLPPQYVVKLDAPTALLRLAGDIDGDEVWVYGSEIEVI